MRHQIPSLIAFGCILLAVTMALSIVFKESREITRQYDEISAMEIPTKKKPALPRP